ncbi:MAG: enoyl-CoA hydratase/isomerase family protein [Proteobacteria bacterium]|nr:enoyl-CoA hydratase/isomerase family protein [Pseudomonadota bacterium]
MTKWDTGTNDLLADVENGVAVLTMNRPERRNALSSAMLGALAGTLERCEMDSTIGCVVLTGAGGAFCAGGDVKGMAEGADVGPPGAGRDIDSRIHQQRVSQRATSGRLHRMPKPTIAALPGAAAGAGLSLALACDLRIAAENAVMTTAFARVGFSGDYGGTYFLSQLVGSAKAREMYLLCDRIDMKEAERLGLVNWVVPANTLESKTMEIARRLASGPRVAYRYMKENLNRAANGAWDDCMDLEATHHVHCAATDDHKEAARAFVEKREPVFKGR